MPMFFCGGEKVTRHKRPMVADVRPWYNHDPFGNRWSSNEFVTVRFRCAVCATHWERKAELHGPWRRIEGGEAFYAAILKVRGIDRPVECPPIRPI